MAVGTAITTTRYSNGWIECHPVAINIIHWVGSVKCASRNSKSSPGHRICSVCRINCQDAAGVRTCPSQTGCYLSQHVLVAGQKIAVFLSVDISVILYFGAVAVKTAVI